MNPNLERIPSNWSIRLAGGKHHFFTLLIVSLILTLSAGTCTRGNDEPDLEGVTWVLRIYNNTIPIKGAQPTIQFEGGQISETTGCNHYGGGYQVKEDAITLGDLFRTEIGCMESEGVMEQERIYLELLGTAQRFELVDGVLTIFEGPHQALTFERQ